MEAKNLRIGNLVGIQKTALHSDGCNTLNAVFEIGELKKDVVHFKGFDTGEYYKNLKPIELNDAYLDLYGFKKVGINYEKGWLLLWRNKETNTIDFVINEPHSNKRNIRHLRYVNELQNLFFALTGTELELTHESSACS